MVFFVFSKSGFEEIKRISSGNKTAIWVNGGILSDKEIELARASGLNLTNFGSKIDVLDSEQMTSAIETLSEHHPHESIWIERGS